LALSFLPDLAFGSIHNFPIGKTSTRTPSDGVYSFKGYSLWNRRNSLNPNKTKAEKIMILYQTEKNKQDSWQISIPLKDIDTYR
ncbi:hypothetical protein BpHYR1_034783, partial [Brachionus plicatilis]